MSPAVASAPDQTENFSDPQLAVSEIDCYNHLRNVWLGGMAKELTRHLKETLHDELEAINSRLRVSTSMETVLRAMDKVLHSRDALCEYPEC